MVFDKIKKALSQNSDGFPDNEYLEIDFSEEEKDKKVSVKLFVLHDYEDVHKILEAIRGGYTIVVIDIKTLRQKDPIELKRVISKVKKTIDAIDGSIAGFGENLVIATPAFAVISKDSSLRKEHSDAERFE